MLSNIDIDQLTACVGRAMPGLAPKRVAAYAERLVAETDERLEPNVAEWIAGEPLSDIWLGQYCMGLVMRIQGRGFLTALEALNCYAADPAKGESLIWRVSR